MLFDSIHHEIKGKSILRGVYLKIELGKICGLFGPNGSGKTTLIKIGAGLILPTSGTIFIDGGSFIQKKLISRYKKIAYLPQETFLPRDITVNGFLKTLPNKSKQLVSNNYPKKLMNHLIGSLSYGELKLLELIFVISLDRMFLLLDEPFTGIEPLVIEKMIDLISKQRESGKGVLITDHYYQYTSQVSDLAFWLKDGKSYSLCGHIDIDKQLRAKGYLPNT